MSSIIQGVPTSRGDDSRKAYIPSHPVQVTRQELHQRKGNHFQRDQQLQSARRLTAAELIVIRDHSLGVLSGDVKPLAAVAQVLVLHRQVLDQDPVLVLQSMSEGAVKPAVPVLQFVIAIPSGEYILVELDHRQDTRV